MALTAAPPADLFYGLFEWHRQPDGRGQLISSARPPKTIPDPHTGAPLRVAAAEVRDGGICPSCARFGAGGFVSFVADLRLAFACPRCQRLVWIGDA